jgi:hypothetical protein
MFCGSESCGGKHFFDCQTGSVRMNKDLWVNEFLQYRCRHCKETTKTYALAFRHVSRGEGELFKYGEQPPFGPMFLDGSVNSSETTGSFSQKVADVRDRAWE